MTDENTTAEDAARANEAMLSGYWCRAMEALVEQGIPWPEAARSMLSIAALQVEAALGASVAEKGLDAARAYMVEKQKRPDHVNRHASNAQH